MIQMSRWVAGGAVLACLVLLGGAGVPAAEKKGKTIESKEEKRAPAATIDFAAELGLSFPSLKGLGLRIDQARTAPDPVGLAMAASELAVAEKVSGKAAKIKAADLMKGAVQLALRRNVPEELKAVALLVHDKKVAGDLTDAAAKAQAQVDARKGGEKSRGIERYLVVKNNTRYYIRIYVNGRYVGTSEPFDTAKKYVGDSPFSDTVLYAIGPAGTWGPRRVSTAVDNYIWELNY